MRKSAKIIWLFLGFLCLGLGTIGVILPILPTVPFYMATVVCFAKSSKRLHDWFVESTLYRKHLAAFVQKRSMTMQTKFTILGSVTGIMAIAFLCMRNVPIGRICLLIVWICHVWYFLFRVATEKEEKNV